MFYTVKFFVENKLIGPYQFLSDFIFKNEDIAKEYANRFIATCDDADVMINFIIVSFYPAE